MFDDLQKQYRKATHKLNTIALPIGKYLMQEKLIATRCYFLELESLLKDASEGYFVFFLLKSPCHLYLGEGMKSYTLAARQK